MQATIDGTPKRPFFPFLARFVQPIRAGIKTHTLRSRPYGKPGDLFNTPAGTIRLLEVREATVGWVCQNLWREEGCQSPADFREVWMSLHRGHWFEDAVRWLHRFEYVPPAAEEVLHA